MAELDEGYVVVAFRAAPYDAPGRYGLVPSEIWRNEFDVVPLVRGPHQPQERIAREDLYEEECRAVQVTKDGLYTCEVMMGDDFQEAVKEAAEKLFDELANERAAEAHSYIHDGDEEEFGDEVFKIAKFGDATAVNGDLIWNKKDAKPPRGYVKDADLGGWIGDGSEEEIDLSDDHVARGIVDTVAKALGRPAYVESIQQALDAEYKKKSNSSSHYVLWGSDSGDVEVWVSKKAWNKKYGRRAQEERLRLEAQNRAHREELRQRELERKRQAEEHQRRLKEGGYPLPEDWDPRVRGLDPGDFDSRKFEP